MESKSLEQLPTHILVDIFKFIEPKQLEKLKLVCPTFHDVINNCRRSLQSRNAFYTDLNPQRLRLWHSRTTCEKIPFGEIKEIIKMYLSFVSTCVLFLAKPTAELCEFLISQCKSRNLRFDNLLIHHIPPDLTYSTISDLMVYGGCERLFVGPGGSRMTPADLQLPGLKQAHLLAFDMDQTIHDDVFKAVLRTNCKEFMFLDCNKITAQTINAILQEWYRGNKEISCFKITTNKNIQAEAFFEGLPVERFSTSRWYLTNLKKDKKALITSRRSIPHFFVSFEVNSRTEDMMLKKPYGHV